MVLQQALSAREYMGDDMVLIIGRSKYSVEFKQFKEYWLLDKYNRNTDGGIIVYVNDFTETIDSVVIAGYDFTRNETSYRFCTSRLPFGIDMRDDSSALNLKLGTPLKVGFNSILSSFSNMMLETVFADNSYSKIRYLRVFLDKRSKTEQVPVLPSSFKVEKEVPLVKEKYDSVKKVIDAQVTMPLAVPDKTKSAQPVITEFKRAVTTVLESGSLLDYLDVVAERKTQPNYWNYKYTYATKVKVPGEKYSMVYRFPFADSPMDFVTVFAESDTYDSNFTAKYHAVEANLIKNFTKSEGWISACSPNDDKTKVTDLEFKNAYLGSIVLDYQKTPKGKHILYMRFLPNNN